jgi:ArsR family transcriptional regulator, arsenate/arsenite/antimonite-responsive transcriptional repressor / arsenate reductase (thioredoxin)
MIEQAPEVLKILAHDLRWSLLKALTISDHQVNELVERVNQPMNLVSYHLKKMRDDHLVSTRRSEADGRDIYYSLDLDRLQGLFQAAGAALHPRIATLDSSIGAGTLKNSQASVLFVCTHNSARSQMAEGLLRHLSDGQIEVTSAGSHPSSVHPLAVETMDRHGVDIRQQESKSLIALEGQYFDYIITVCDKARESCPTFLGEGQQMHWGFPDPIAVNGPDHQRRAFEDIARRLKTRIAYFLHEIRASELK